jgi:putative transposase
MPKRRRWDSKTKARIVLEVIGGVLSPAEACRKYELAESVLSRWKREFLEKAHLVFDSGGSVGAGHNREVEELQQMLGKQAVELEALKKGLGILGQARGKRW